MAEGVKAQRDLTRIGMAEPRRSLVFLAVLGYPLVIKNMSLMPDFMMLKSVKTVVLPRGSR